MSQIDDDLIGTRYRGRDAVTAFNEQMAQEIGSITSRDQIIDPYSLVNMANYRKTRAGIAQYNSDLQQAQQYAERQEAAYLEWYNSPEQQAIRDREAGLNPNLVGLSGSEGVDTQQNPNSPVAGMQTNGQLALESINTALNIMQTVASVGSFAAGLPNIGKQGELLDTQIEAMKLGNITAFEQIAHNAIASNFATFHAAATAAGDAVDVAKYFADDKNFEDIIPSYAPSDSPMYRNALARVRKGSESIIADAYKTNAESLGNQISFAKKLANPYTDPNTLVMAACFEPVMNAIFDAEKEELEFQKLVRDKKKEYMSSIDASEAGEIFMSELRQMQMQRNHQNIIDGAKAYVYENLKMIYQRDGFYTPAGLQSGTLIMGHFPNTAAQIVANYLTGLLGSTMEKGNPLEGTPIEFGSASGVGLPTLGSNGAGAFVPPNSAVTFGKVK